jgi:hypothetical protein
MQLSWLFWFRESQFFHIGNGSFFRWQVEFVVRVLQNSFSTQLQMIEDCPDSELWFRFPWNPLSHKVTKTVIGDLRWQTLLSTQIISLCDMLWNWWSSNKFTFLISPADPPAARGKTERRSIEEQYLSIFLPARVGEDSCQGIRPSCELPMGLR